MNTDLLDALRARLGPTRFLVGADVPERFMADAARQTPVRPAAVALPDNTEDVAAVLFDEPLTVIDPHLKWQLRRKLKQIHRELRLTLVYVTHDQVEALTFADQVVVMMRGRAVQVGTASELFDRPRHTFVGHFIGSPGMNFVPARGTGTGIEVAGVPMPAPQPALAALDRFTVGIRPEYLVPVAAGSDGAVEAHVTQSLDVGTYRLVTAEVGTGAAVTVVRARLSADDPMPAPGDRLSLRLLGPWTRYYRDEELIA